MRKYWVKKFNENGVAFSVFVHANSSEEAIGVALVKARSICTEDDCFRVVKIGRRG